VDKGKPERRLAGVDYDSHRIALGRKRPIELRRLAGKGR
jgi:hypothetical protein